MTTIERVKQVQLPIGEAQRINKFTQDNWYNYLVQFGQVKNKVLWVNPDMHIPFQLEVGKPSPLGLFAESVLKENPENSQEGKFVAETWPSHNRSVVLGRAIVGDNEGRKYRDIDLKGSGFTVHSNYDGLIRIKKSGIMNGISGNYFGLFDKESAEYDREMTDKFLNLGIRTSRTLATIGLEEIIDEGKIVSVGELKKIYNIPDKFEPVLALRAFRTKSRISDLTMQPAAVVEMLIADAKKLVSEEIGLGRVMSDKQYSIWFAKTIGRNVGLLHAGGLVHRYLSEHNITLDGSIVDLDSVDKFSEDDLFNDLFTLLQSFRVFTKEVRVTPSFAFDNRLFLEKLCTSSYKEAISPKILSIEQKEILSGFGIDW